MITSLLRGPHGNRGRADLDIGGTVAQDLEHRGAAGNLDQVMSVFQLADAHLGSVSEANHVVRIELNFGGGVLSGGQEIVDQQWSVGRCGSQVSGIAAADSDVAIHQADASHAVVGRFAIVRLLLLGPGRQDRGAREQDR